MSDQPVISVVTGVYNAGSDLELTIASILDQEGVDLEYIVVDDGSTDDTGAILDTLAGRDNRVKVIHNEHEGLTSALIKGCETAKGEFIARQDVGDISLPGRFRKQLAFLHKHPELTMVACATRNLGPSGEELYVSHIETEELNYSLRSLDIESIRGPSHHGATLFRRDTYCKAGGYRREFKVAQDLDLWTRIIEQGPVAAMREVLYETTWNPGSISHLKRELQVLATQAIVDCASRRRDGRPEEPILQRLSEQFERRNPDSIFHTPRRLIDARFDYYIGSLLSESDPNQAQKYFRKAIAKWPFHLKAWWKLLALFMNSSRNIHQAL